MIVGAFLLAVLSAQQTQGEPPPQASDLKVVITTAVYQPDGGVSVETAPISGTVPSVVHLYSRGSVCDAAMSGATEPRDAGFGWRLAARPVRAGAGDVVVSIDWLRVWDRGQRLSTGPSGTVQLTLHPGDRIPLDYIPNPRANEACRAVGLGLEIRLARTTAAVAPNSELIPLGAKEGAGPGYSADLWLVHTPPAGTEQAQHQRVRLTDDGGSFSFPAVTVPTVKGEMAVGISGSFKRYRTPTGAEFMYVSMMRGLNGAALPAGGVTAGTGTMIAVPGPAEVLSLELPTSGGSGGRVARGGGVGTAGGPRGGGGGGAGGGSVGAGGGAVARSRGGFGAAAPPAGGGTGEGSAQGGPAIARGAGGRGTGAATARGSSPTAEIAAALAGHTFSLRLRLTPVQ